MDSRFSVYRGDGLNAIDIHANRTVASFIASLDVGLNWAFARNMSVYGGYRFMAVTGVGTADQQFPHFLIDSPEIATIKLEQQPRVARHHLRLDGLGSRRKAADDGLSTTPSGRDLQQT